MGGAFAGLKAFGGLLLSGAGHAKNVVISALGLGTAGALVDTNFNGGRVTQHILGGIWKSLGFAQEDAGKDTGYYGIGKIFDNIGKFLTEIFGRNSVTDGIRNFSQGMMGIPEKDREFGAAANEVKGINTPSPNSPNSNAPAPDAPSEVNANSLARDGVAGITSLFTAKAAVSIGAASRAIPIVGGVFAGITTLWDAGGMALKGEWDKAAVRLASGTVDTVGSSLGFLGMAWGAAGREAIEEGAQAVLGDKVDMEDGPLTQIAYDIKDAIFPAPEHNKGWS